MRWRKNGYRKSRLWKRRLAAVFLLILLVFIVGVCLFETRLSGVISGMAENKVKAKAAIIMSTAIYDEVEKDEITYDRLVSFEKDEAGRITALKTNIIEINRLKSKLSVKILEALAEMDTAQLEVPLGTVVGSELFSGKGPGIRVNVIPVGSVDAEIVNEISSAGINQSRHQIMMKVTADLTIITA
ncbi:MAG: sporulation protein YunB, partial [Eubacteriales bacterium]